MHAWIHINQITKINNKIVSKLIFRAKVPQKEQPRQHQGWKPVLFVRQRQACSFLPAAHTTSTNSFHAN